MEDAISNSLTRSVLSLITRRRRPKAGAHPPAAARIARPVARPQAPARAVVARAGASRRRAPHPCYIHGHYLSGAGRSARATQPLFRVA